MKIIHTADIHLDSPLKGVADGKLRRAELLRAFSNLAEYAVNNKVAAVIVAGDLFDGDFATQATMMGVADVINGSRNVVWFVLRGNHGSDKPYRRLAELCPNVKFFGNDWTSYRLGNVCVCGRELGGDKQPWGQLPLDGDYNIVVLHGDVDSADYGFIDKKALAQSNADYVALGHRHTFCKHLFGRVKGAYCGALESRGFDETAETGFVVIDTDTDVQTFVAMPIRRVVTVTADITDIHSVVALEQKLKDVVAAVDARNYLNLVLTGKTDGFIDVEAAVAGAGLAERFFALRVEDNTVENVDVAGIAAEISLRGEFVKLAMQIEDEKLRNDVIRLGLAAVKGDLA